MTSVKISEGHDNFFTPLRIIMALMVVLGHAAVVKTGNSSAEPGLFFAYTPSYTAVNAFFIVSGHDLYYGRRCHINAGYRLSDTS